MIKKLSLYILMSLFFGSCDTDSAWDCVQTTGAQISKVFQVDNFNKLRVNRNIRVVLQEGPPLVEVFTGENLINDIRVVVQDNQLELSNNNYCNLVRDYDQTTVRVTAPNLTKIRNSSQYSISSQGLLNYSDLTLVSEDYNEPNSVAVGDFILDINAENLKIVSNNMSTYFINGYVTSLNVAFYSGLGRFEGANLTSIHTQIYHRGENDIIVNPQQSLKGELRSTGNLICVQTPTIIEVVQYYTGEVLFLD